MRIVDLSLENGCPSVCPYYDNTTRRCTMGDNDDDCPTLAIIELPKNAKNIDIFKEVFGMYPAELWCLSENEYLEWVKNVYGGEKK